MYKTSKDSSKKIRVYPQGLAISGDELTSFVLFKDQVGTVSFPIWCPVIPMGLMQNEGDVTLKNPYDFTHDLLEKLDFKITECIFDNIEADEQKASICVERKNSAESDIEIKSSKKTKKKQSEQLSLLEANLTSKPDMFRPVQKIKVRAYEALALCGSKKDIIFSATDLFIKKTRDVAVFEKNNPSELLKKNSFLKSRQKYLM